MKDFIKINENDNVIRGIEGTDSRGDHSGGNTGGYSKGNDPGGTQDGNPRYCGPEPR